MNPLVNGNGGPPETASYDTKTQVQAMLDAMLVITRKGSMSQSMAEAKDAAAAVLSFSQAIVVLDPALNQAGVPLEHELAMEAQRQEGARLLEEVKQRSAAQAPTPRKKIVASPREGGGMTYEEQ